MATREGKDDKEVTMDMKTGEAMKAREAREAREAKEDGGAHSWA